MQSVTVAALALVFAVIAACSTIQYRDVQGEFVNAVAADNTWSVSPFGANASEGLYSSVLVQLTDEYIAKLAVRLVPNAWLLRAVSEWRLAEFENAQTSARKGLNAIQDNQLGSRDHVMLAMLDGLIIDSDLRARFLDLKKVPDSQFITLESYQKPFSTDFPTGLDSLDKGFALAGPATPPELGWYYHYHRWRLIQNWRTVINNLADDNRTAARVEAEAKVGKKLRTAMDAERDMIPDGHPLRELIRAQGGG